jgi:hypothetical protein
VCHLPSVDVEAIERFEADVVDRLVHRVVHRPAGGPNGVRCC